MDKIKLTVETEPQAKKLLLDFLEKICSGKFPKSNIDESFYFYLMLQRLVNLDYDISCYRVFAFVECVFNDYCSEKSKK